MNNRDRFYISKSSKTFVGELDEMKLKSRNPLGLNDLSRLDLFKIAVALGINEPRDFDGAKEGLFLLKDLKSPKDKALFNIVLLGEAKTNDEIDNYCDPEQNYVVCEKCANSGFRKLREKVINSSSDELLRKQLLNELDILYNKNVKLN